jgi:predicted dehydrogenase
MSDRLKVGIIGCGRAAERLHVPALQRSEELDVVAVADIDIGRAAALARTASACASYQDAGEMVDKSVLDALIIATPPNRHLEDLRLGVGAGLPVLVEKPIVCAADQLAHLHKLGDAIPILVAYNRRLWAPVQALKRTIDSCGGKAIGECAMRLTTDLSAWAPFMSDSDVIDDLATHCLDLALFLFGRPPVAACAIWEGPSRLKARLCLEGGIVVGILAAHEDHYFEEIAVTLDGADYRLHASSDRLYPACGLRRRCLDMGDAIGRRLTGTRYSMRRSYDLQLKRFADVIRGRISSEPDLRDAIMVVKIMSALRRSAENDGQETPIESESTRS